MLNQTRNKRRLVFILGIYVRWLARSFFPSLRSGKKKEICTQEVNDEYRVHGNNKAIRRVVDWVDRGNSRS